MAKAVVNAVRNVDVGVTDLKAAAKFWSDVWGLRPVQESADAIYLRGTGPFHHIVALHKRPKAELLRVTLATSGKAEVDALHGALKDTGVKEIEAPAGIAEPGGGYGFAFHDPEGRTLRILAGDQRHGDAADAEGRPRKVSHVVLNSTDAAAGTDFYCRTLGFKMSDRTQRMTFLRCNSDHHSVALVQSDLRTLHHIAFEMPTYDSVMRGAGRMRDNGFAMEWGVGRHGPGNNVFAYFVGPEDVAIEYTAEVEQVDDSYRTGGPEDWKWPPGRNDRWGIAQGPTKRLEEAHHRIAFPREIFHAAG